MEMRRCKYSLARMILCSICFYISHEQTAVAMYKNVLKWDNILYVNNKI